MSSAQPSQYQNPEPHPSGARMPYFQPELVPRHIAIVMDGNGRWANQRGLPRSEGHRAGERAMIEVMAGAVEAGVQHMSLYAFSTENWKRSPEEVRFIMGYSRQSIRRQRELLNSWGVRIRWNGQRPRLWRSVIKELETAQEFTQHNTRATLTMCFNYGSRAEITQSVQQIAAKAARGELDPKKITEATVAAHLADPDAPDVDLFLRSSGEQRISNFLLWQSAYAELVFLDTLWPDVDRRTLWEAIDIYARRDRRYGGAIDAVTDQKHAAAVTDQNRAANGPADERHNRAPEQLR